MRKKHFLEVLFLMETMNYRNVLVDLQVWLGYDKLDSVSFYASCVYGPSDWSSRCELWERLSRIGVNRKDGWCVFGDFNDILHNGEKVGGTWRADESFEPYNQIIKAEKLEELPSHGDGLHGEEEGEICGSNLGLTDVLATELGLRSFLAQTSSLWLKEDQIIVLFDRRLLDLDGIKDSVTNAWHVADGSRMGTVSSRLKACRKALSALKKRSDMNSRERIRQLEFDLEQQQSSHDPSVYQIHALKRDLVKAYRDEEIYWWQKSNEKWMYAGDRNTKFFQNSVKAARAKNNIEKLLNDRGEESSNPKPFDSWFQGMAPRVTDQMNWFLNKPVTAEEVKEAMFSIKPSKAPGPDVSYSILINDQPHGLVVPQRGLRQGDPLSPFLFVLCAEGLSHLLTKAEEEGSITGMSFGDHGPSVNHLLFADDCLLVCKANEEQSDHLLRVLHRYEEVTGQVINPTKSSITFGKGISEEVKSNVRRKMGIEAEGGASKYLGLPECLKGSKVGMRRPFLKGVKRFS
ncbi:PREDICTED: uncharacterized protein LOC106344676 [Brassica oleracea var. oleracea]|uniref:uncharacterized protein LOC106344676 n=1 Tax=Brassica oleracea var. oleracea TaxID=109376 RepID=UPI0006A745B0|nr:PREDICTED: uncharacterized protein LOC106344676 [Brassica oleracea var. oleracea]